MSPPATPDPPKPFFVRAAALIAGITGFITAITALVAALKLFPIPTLQFLLPSYRESGFVKAAKDADKILSNVHFFLDGKPQCNFAQQKYGELRSRVPRDDKVGDVTRDFDEANSDLKRLAEYRSLQQIFIKLEDVKAWRNDASRDGCLSFE